MHDQAIKLRSLMRDSARRGSCEKLRIVAVSGAKGGVGTTTIALSLALAFRRRQWRAALIDFQRGSSSLMEMAPADDNAPISDRRGAGGGLNDVFTGTASWAEALRGGREGILVAGDDWAAGREAVQPIVASPNVRARLAELDEHSDVAVLDLGGGSNGIAADCWALADEIVLVTMAETISVMDAYATIKSLCSVGESAPVSLIVNQATKRQASAVAKRLTHTCSRFLNLQIDQVLETPVDASLRETALSARPTNRGNELIQALEPLNALSRLADRQISRSWAV